MKPVLATPRKPSSIASTTDSPLVHTLAVHSACHSFPLPAQSMGPLPMSPPFQRLAPVPLSTFPSGDSTGGLGVLGRVLFCFFV